MPRVLSLLSGAVLLFAVAALASGCDLPGSSPAVPAAAATAARLPAVTRTPPTPRPAQPSATSVSIAPPTEVPTPLAPPTIALDITQVKKQLTQVEADTANMRGLKSTKSVPEYFISGAEMKYRMTQQTLREYPADMARLDATTLWLLLFIDNRFTDFRQLQIDFSGSALLGYYDQEKKELFVRTDNATLSPQSRETLAHEYVHSLQDQHHDLSRLLPVGQRHDADMAARALVEGDATISGLLYASRYMTKRDFMQVFTENSDQLAPPVPGRAPVYLQEEWQFPYTYGAQFVMSLSAPGVYGPIDAALADPPKSTEQVLHPEKYFSTPRDDPRPVSLPPMTSTLGTGWSLVRSDTLGEFDLDVLLRENYVINPQAVEGWGGARYDIYANGDQYIAIMGSVWDTPRDLAEFEDSFTQSFKLFHKSNGLWTDRGRIWGLKRSGQQLMFVCGTSRPLVEKVLAGLAP